MFKRGLNLTKRDWHRLQNLKGTYVPKQEQFFYRIAIKIVGRKGQRKAWLCFSMKNGNLDYEEFMSDAELALLDDPDHAAKCIASGTNIIHLKLLNGIDMSAQVLAVVSNHFGALPRESQNSTP